MKPYFFFFMNLFLHILTIYKQSYQIMIFINFTLIDKFHSFENQINKKCTEMDYEKNIYIYLKNTIHK